MSLLPEEDAGLIADVENLSTFGFNPVLFQGQSSAELCSFLVATFGYFCDQRPDDIISNYCDRIPDRLLEQFEEKQELIDLICIFITELQNLEFVFQDLKTLRAIDTASGAQLDGLGDIVCLERMGLGDTEYREAIKTQIGINNSNGEPESMISALKSLTNANTVSLTEIFPATVQMYTDGVLVPSNLLSQMEKVAPAGVRLEIDTSQGAPPEDTFTFFPDAGSIDIGGKGFSEPTVPGSGGVLTEKL